jgi:hypothetical protein
MPKTGCTLLFPALCTAPSGHAVQINYHSTFSAVMGLRIYSYNNYRNHGIYATNVAGPGTTVSLLQYLVGLQLSRHAAVVSGRNCTIVTVAGLSGYHVRRRSLFSQAQTTRLGRIR